MSTHGNRRNNPWYVETMLAIGGWIAGLLAAAAILAFVGLLFKNYANARAAAGTGLAIGLAFVGAGSALGRAGVGDFRRHFSIAMIAAGLTAATLGGWYLIWSLLAGEGKDVVGGDATRIAHAGLATAALYVVPAAFAARRVKDGILTFLATSAWFWIVNASLIMLVDGGRGASLPLRIFPAAAALTGLACFTLARRRLGALGAALLIAPMIFYEVARNGGGFIGIPALHGGVASSFVYAAGAVWCLVQLRDRYPLIGLLAATALIAAGIWFLPDAGAIAILIILAGMAAGHRGLAAVGVVALAWFIGKFYYDLSMTLLTKSAVMAGLGAATLTGALVLRRLQRGPTGSARAPSLDRRPVVVSLLFGGLLLGALGLVNRSVIELEADFKDARSIYLPLGPVDPRSIIQGDYMVLAFRETIYPPFEEIEPLPERGEVFLKLDGDGVASFSRLAQAGDAAAGDEIRIDYVKRGSVMRYCPDSYFFQEGEADAFALARFAVLKVAPDGKTRLVALADADRKVIEPPRR